MNYLNRITAAIIILAAVLWAAWTTKNDIETAADDVASEEIEREAEEPVDSPIGTSTEQIIDPENRERSRETDDVEGMFGRISPAEIENAVFQRVAEQSGLKMTNLNSVDCDMKKCTIVFSGLKANPQYVDEYSELLGALTNQPWKDYQPTSSGIGTREVSPGAREYVIGFNYVALVETSDDPNIAARQYAACAGAWARVAQQRGSDEYIRGAHEQAAEWLEMSASVLGLQEAQRLADELQFGEMSASVLGLQEAQRLADELQFGPLARDCHATPY